MRLSAHPADDTAKAPVTAGEPATEIPDLTEPAPLPPDARPAKESTRGPMVGRTRHLVVPLTVWAVVMITLLETMQTLVHDQQSQARQRFTERVETAAAFTDAYLDEQVARQIRWGEQFLAGPVIEQTALDRAAIVLGFVTLGVLDAQGRVIATTPRNPKLIGSDTAATNPFLRRALDENRPQFSPVFRSLVRPLAVVGVAVPYASAAGRRVLTGAPSLQVSPLGVYVERSVSVPGGRAYLVDEAGNLVAGIGYDGAEVTPLTKLAPRLAAAMMIRPRGIHHKDEQPWTYASVAIPGTNWTLIADVPDSTLYADAAHFRRWMSTTLIGVALIGLVVALLVGAARRRQREADLALRLANDELRTSYAELASRTHQTQAANAELASFAYSVAHDLRAPLRAISGFAEALLEDYGDRLDDTGRRYARRMREASHTMGRLIDDLLELSRLSRTAVRRTSVDLTALTHEVAASLRADEPGRDVDLRVADGVVASADPMLIRTVLENLLGNAWKFTSQQPDAVVEFGCHDDGEGPAVYFVADNGVGFDPTYVDKLYQPFQRLHTASQYPGTGIGLASVRRIVERHGGRVWAEGAVGRGATFYFTLEADR